MCTYPRADLSRNTGKLWVGGKRSQIVHSFYQRTSGSLTILPVLLVKCSIQSLHRRHCTVVRITLTALFNRNRCPSYLCMPSFWFLGWIPVGTKHFCILLVYPCAFKPSGVYARDHLYFIHLLVTPAFSLIIHTTHSFLALLSHLFRRLDDATYLQ